MLQLIQIFKLEQILLYPIRYYLLVQINLRKFHKRPNGLPDFWLVNNFEIAFEYYGMVDCGLVHYLATPSGTTRALGLVVRREDLGARRKPSVRWSERRGEKGKGERSTPEPGQ